MLQAFRKLRNVLGARQRRNTVLIFAMMVILGLLEAGSVASIMPFLAVLMHPGIVQSNTYLAALYSRLAFSDTNAFLVFLAAVVFVVVVGRIAFTALTQYALVRYSAGLNYLLSVWLLEKYLRQPYVWFLNHHSSDLGKSILAEVDQVVDQSLNSRTSSHCASHRDHVHRDSADVRGSGDDGFDHARARGRLHGRVLGRPQLP